MAFVRLGFRLVAELSVFTIMLNRKTVIQDGSHESYALLMRLKHKELESHRAGVAA